MPELDEVLRKAATAYEVQPPDFGSLLTSASRRRHRRRTTSVIALVAAVLVIGGVPTVIHLVADPSPGVDSVSPAPAGTTTKGNDASGTATATEQDSPLLDGVRTDVDGRGLVANYVGGACDSPARLTAHESATRIDVEVTFSGAQVAQTCPAIGIMRTLGVRLSAPIGNRVITSGPRTLVPFDGRRLLAPGYLPAGFVASGEQGSDGGADPAGAQPSVPAGAAASDATTEWTREYSAPGKPDTGNRCTPGTGYLDITQGPPGSSDLSDQWGKVGTEKIGPETAVLWKQNVPGISGWAVIWPGAGGEVSVFAATGCDGDKIPPLSEVVAVAKSLH